MNPRLPLAMTLLAATLAACDAADMPSDAAESGDSGAAVGSAVSINAGGSATGSFAADAYFSGGSTYSTTNTIDTSQVPGSVPPQAVFQTERYGEFTYTIPNLTPGSTQTVTLYFEESYWTAAGQRTFNVAINGATVLAAFDIYAAAGGQNRAIARTFTTTASSSGQVVIQFTRSGGPDNPKVCGITAVEGIGSTYPLTVNKAGNGSGTVTGSGIDCGSACSASYASGTTVTLSAAPAAGSSFGGWSGACTGTGTCIVSMTDVRTATATFALVGNVTTTSVNAGGGASGSFVADAWYSGGSTYSSTSTIDTSQLASPVPAQAVLQTERYGEFTYTVPNRAPNTAQTVTLYFVESYWTAAGQRTFNVTINGATVLTAFDIFASAGGSNRAISRTFAATANGSGQVVIQFTRSGGPDNPKVSGITVSGPPGGGAYQPCPTSGDCRILPFGDSITDGYTVAGGYRIPLFSTAHAAGKHLTFVGSLVNGPTTVDGVAFPRNHEGHSGWTISQITGLVPSPALNTMPHIVLLMIGTNDMYGSSSGVPAAVQRLDALLGKLVSAAPNALIVVAQITPLSDSGREALVRSYNAGIPAIVNARAAQGQHVVLVDQHTNFPTSELADGTHPNSAGYARMAGVWYAAIGSLLR